MARPILKFQIADYRMTLFCLGYLSLDGGAMFGVVPRTLWSKLMAPDEQHRVRLATNCLLIEYGDEKIFLETGNGTKFDEKYRKIYGIEHEAGEGPYETPVDLALQSVGLKSGDITQALFTHLHFDHAGGATRPMPDGSIVPTFENARYRVHKGEWEYGCDPHERCRASYLKENLAPLKASGQLSLMEGDQTEILPGLRMQVTGGHTPYHQVMILELPEGGFIYWGDLLPTRHHVKIPYVMGYDEYPVETMAAKRRLLKEAAEKGWIHLFEHDPDMGGCLLEPGGQPDAYEIKPLPAGYGVDLQTV